MTRLPPRCQFLLLSICLAALLPPVAGQGTGMTPGGREAMWPAPTEADWQRPCLITFQRNWQDALAVSQETGKPILICVNMDGEIASEHYAGIRYRQPDIAVLYQPYVSVIASVYRHTPRDHDEQGRRILCPRFGSVTCGEHIAIEPGLFEKYFEGKRIAPRHIMIELDSQETYDVYYAFDTASVFTAIREGITRRKISPKPVVRGDRSLLERVASPDIADRKAVEAAYLEGDRKARRSIMEAAVGCGEAVPLEVLRLALSGFDAEVSQVARKALTQARGSGTIDLLSDALRAPMKAEERDALISALAKLGEGSLRAKRLSVVHRGLSSSSRAVDASGWAEGLDGGAAYAPAVDRAGMTARLEGQGEVFDSEDADKHVELAEAFLARAIESNEQGRRQKRFTQALFGDARDTALKAIKLGATGWQVNAVLAIAALNLGNKGEAHVRAEAAVGSLPSAPKSRNAMLVLALFAEARHDSIAKAIKTKKDWPGQWLTDMHAAHSLLVRHPLGTDTQVVGHYDFLKWIGARGQASRFLDDGLARFPDSWILHDRLRRRILRSKGVAGLETVYERMLGAQDAPTHLDWFAGFASIVTAEFHRRSGKGAKALGAYDRAIAHYKKSIERSADTADTSAHFISMALGGRARLAYESQDHEGALQAVLASFNKSPGSAASRDGLNISPVDTAKMLLARLKELKRTDLATKLQAGLDKLDPDLLKLPAYEGAGPQGGRRGPRSGRRGRGRQQRDG